MVFAAFTLHNMQETHSASTLDQHSPQTPLWERNMSTIPTYHQMRAGMRDCSLEACFDFARCTTGMKVYVYPSALWSRVSSHVKQGCVRSSSAFYDLPGLPFNNHSCFVYHDVACIETLCCPKRDCFFLSPWLLGLK